VIHDLPRRIVQARAGGRVERAHGIPHIGSYSNAGHSWGVAMLMMQIWPEHFPRLAGHCISHDVPEAWSGDMPAPMGRYAGIKHHVSRIESLLQNDLGLPDEHELEEEDLAMLKACDRLEFWLWTREQELMGNQMVSESRRETERFFLETPLPDRAQTLFLHLVDHPLLPRQAGVIKELCE
jgi:hypothetical protein